MKNILTQLIKKIEILNSTKNDLNGLENEDKIIEKENKIDKLEDINKQIEEIINKIKEIKNYEKEITEEMIKNGKEINKLIDEVNEIKENKMKEQQKFEPNKAKIFESIFEYNKNEFEKNKMNIKQYEHKMIRRNEYEIIENICEFTGMEIKKILFDSNIDKWNMNNSDFGKKLEGKRNVIIVIEDKERNIFGGFISKEINQDKYLVI